MRPVPGWFRYLSYVMAALFAVCVALQYNDPDPIRWMAIYGATMIVTAVLPSKRQLWPAAFAVAAITLAWSLVLLLGIWGKVSPSDAFLKMSEKGGAVEEEREFGGLAICFAWLVFAGWFRLRRD